MKKKGFTLIELLAVIVILAIIALIAVPMVLNIIEKSKVGALKSSLTGLIESADMYYANNQLQGGNASETIFDFEKGKQTNDSGATLEYKGKIENGKLILHANGEVAACIDDGTYYAYRNKDDNEVTTGIGTCVYDGTTGDFSSNQDNNGVYYLGTGTSFDIKILLPNVDYTKLTADNFIVSVSTISITGGGNPGYRDDLRWTNSVSQISKSYNSTTGILTVSGGSGSSRCYSNSSPTNYSTASTMSTTKAVYLVLGDIK